MITILTTDLMKEYAKVEINKREVLGLENNTYYLLHLTNIYNIENGEEYDEEHLEKLTKDEAMEYLNRNN